MFGFVSRTRSVKQRAESLVRLNLELAKLEAKKKAAALGVAAGLPHSSPWFSSSMQSASLSQQPQRGLSEALPLWLSLLIVTGVILALAAIAGLLARRSARKASPAQPSQAIEEAQQTVEALRSHV